MGLDVPIVNAPMGGAAGGGLAAAVSRAGGLGMVGMGSAATGDLLSAELAPVRDLGLPFGIGLVHWVMTARPELLDIALTARPALLSVSFGDDWNWVRRAQDAGVATVTQVPTVDAARRAVAAGVDVVVARGAEGGGHGEPRMGTLPLLADVLDAVDVPVLAAGGIASPRGLAAVLAAGAAGAWVGTAFAVCPEAVTASDARSALLDAAGTDTTVTREFDLAQGYPWPAYLPERVLTDRAGAATPVNAGQAVGQVSAAEPADALIARWVEGAAALLSRWGGLSAAGGD
ncbi:2-nitropropane dioxygenase [Mycobacterium sp. 852013-51886_SCH5428379]|uniref:NAD(P)H-dependent flavin oxidoreductase n=1 Tax=Mycobacterium sp. 852013-51886_SCH5428379 TaxID=1834111 RepID=UPI000800EF47|nr:nitronate monooxygenase [Mycobacterium sp. 852013-51886_SCH5428379]OBB58167.1 2-nitropropane dioxygenase [Mycobacterium sp. 852013-51886_SCH5428379]